MYFNLPEQQLITGKNIIPVYASSDADITGFQISMPVQGLDNIFISNGSLNMTDDNYSFINGILNISWHQTENKKINEGDILFFLHLDAKVDNKLSNAMVFEMKKGLKPEYYTADDASNKLAWRIDRGKTNAFVIYGNTPNPWNNETSINFSLPEDGEVSLKIRDITGRIIYSTKNFFYKGENAVRVASEELGASGILLYDLTFGKEVKTMKMLNIK